MRALKQHQGIVAPMDRSNVDTDMIIPKIGRASCRERV